MPRSEQPERVCHDEQRAEAHCRRGDHGAERDPPLRIKHARCHRNSERVVEERPEQVLPDVAHDALAVPQRARDALEVVVHKHDVGRVDGDVGARGGRNTDVSACQRG